MYTLKRLRRAVSHLPTSHLPRGGTAQLQRGAHWPEISPTGKNEIKVSTWLTQNTERIGMAKLDVARNREKGKEYTPTSMHFSGSSDLANLLVDSTKGPTYGLHRKIHLWTSPTSWCLPQHPACLPWTVPHVFLYLTSSEFPQIGI